MNCVMPINSPETAIVTGLPGRCQLLLVNIQESDEGEYDVIFPGYLPDNVRQLSISVTHPQEEPQPSGDTSLPQPQPREGGEGSGSIGLILLAVIGWVGFVLCVGFIIFTKKFNKSANVQVPDGDGSSTEHWQSVSCTEKRLMGNGLF